jgi:hypothetical protein
MLAIWQIPYQKFTLIRLCHRAEDACHFWQVILSASRTTRFTYSLLEKGGDQLDQLCEKLKIIEQSQERKEYPKYNKKKEG